MIVRKFLLVTIAASAAAVAQSPSNQNPKALFQAKCLTCHNAGNSVGAPLQENLRRMSWKTILTALESGRMSGIGNGLTAAEREAVAKFLGTNESQPMPAFASCAAAGGAKQTSLKPGEPSWNGWADPANTRFQPAKAAGLTPASTPKLKFKWAFGFPGVANAIGVATVFGGRVYVGASDGAVYSLDL
jgi:hypothetical protein